MSTDVNMEYQEVKFGEIAKHISKRVEPSETTLEIYVGLEHLDPDSLKITRHGVPSDVAGQKLLVKKGQIIFGKRRAYQRKVAVADWDCICSAHAMVLEAVPGKILPEFLPFFMQSNQFMERAVKVSEGSLSPTIKWKILEREVFRIPNIDKQKRILPIIHSTKNMLEGCYQTLQHLEKLKIVFQSHYLNKFVLNINNRVSGLKLSEIGDFKNGVNKDKDSFGTGNFFINLDDVFSNSTISNCPNGMVECNSKEIDNYKLEEGDILFVRSSVKPSGVALTSIVDCVLDDVVYSGFLIRFRLKKKNLILAKFLNQLFHSPAFRHKVMAYVTVSANSNINQPSLENIRVLLPSEKEMVRIIHTLKNISLMESEINHKLKILSGMHMNLV